MITILMATYNGEKYVAEQIESLLHQTYTEFQLYIRDDASTDNTLAILKEYQNQYPEKIHVQANEKNTGNANSCIFVFSIRPSILIHNQGSG